MIGAPTRGTYPQSEYGEALLAATYAEPAYPTARVALPATTRPVRIRPESELGSSALARWVVARKARPVTKQASQCFISEARPFTNRTKRWERLHYPQMAVTSLEPRQLACDGVATLCQAGSVAFEALDYTIGASRPILAHAVHQTGEQIVRRRFRRRSHTARAGALREGVVVGNAAILDGALHATRYTPETALLAKAVLTAGEKLGTAVLPRARHATAFVGNGRAAPAETASHSRRATAPRSGGSG